MKPHEFLFALTATVGALWAAEYTPAQGYPATPHNVGIIPVAHRDSPLVAFDGASEWLNSRPLTASQLHGKVVLVNFWTYSCINWQRELPYVRAWAGKYKDQGLVVVGVHSPEFGFEKDLASVRDASAQLNVSYPIAVDSEHAIWNAFGNAYWPAIYIIDARGRLRYSHFGEGEYERTEKFIQRLLAEAGAKEVPADLVNARGEGSQADADWADLRSWENYVGYERTEDFVSAGGLARDRVRSYAAPERMRLNAWALAGEWNAGAEFVRSVRANGRIQYRFHARDLHLVMGRAEGAQPVPFRILIDGKPPGDARGADVDAQGRGMLMEHRLYQLVRQTAPVVDRLFEIEFLAPGAEAYSFTFG